MGNSDHGIESRLITRIRPSIGFDTRSTSPCECRDLSNLECPDGPASYLRATN